MECYVDAGRIVKVRGVTPRDCVHLALAELGEHAQSPVTVHLPIGEEEIFIVNDKGEDVGTVRDIDVERNDAEDMLAANEAALYPMLTCAVCGCTDLEPCPGGCYWVHETNGPLNLCSRCAE